jgi:small-conductance mechanosensitive channel
MQAILEFLSGKKTYIVAVVVAVIGLLQACGVDLPESVITILAAFGLASVKSAVKKAE